MGGRDSIIAIAGIPVAVGGGAMTAFAPMVFSDYATEGFYAGLTILLIGVAMLVWGLSRRSKESAVPKKMDTQKYGVRIGPGAEDAEITGGTYYDTLEVGIQNDGKRTKINEPKLGVPAKEAEDD